jgi:hypothetical protein
MEFVCFLWISEQTTNFALHNIKSLVCITAQKDFNISSHLLNKILTTIGTTSTQSEKCSIQSSFNGSSRPDDG